MKVIGACILAFAMYSKVPMPKRAWDERAMEYVFCFFPLVGVLLGGIFILWFWIANFLHLGNILKASIALALPIIYTGGIHLDGFCDTSDALASWGSREKKLEILKDSHIGAFALINCVVYLIIQFGLLCQIIEDDSTGSMIGVLAVVFAFSRSLSALGAVTKKNARGSGMLATFTDAISGKIILLSVILWIALSVALMLYIDLICGLGALCGAIVVYVYYSVMSKKQFGGITGDLAGFFLQLCELGALCGAVLAERLLL